jgi:hypothetical protein
MQVAYPVWSDDQACGVSMVSHNVAGLVSRDEAPFTFLANGVESAVALAVAVAGDGIVGAGGPLSSSVASTPAPLDEIAIDLVCVLLGEACPNRGSLVNPARRCRAIVAAWICGRVAHRECGAADLSYGQDNHVWCLPVIFTMTAPRP